MTTFNFPYDANEFTGKRILVTGGTRGIGEAIVREAPPSGSFKRTLPRGWGLIILSRRPWIDSVALTF